MWEQIATGAWGAGIIAGSDMPFSGPLPGPLELTASSGGDTEYLDGEPDHSGISYLEI